MGKTLHGKEALHLPHPSVLVTPVTFPAVTEESHLG